MDVKTSKISGGCNFRKGKYLRTYRAHNSGPWGRRFESSRPDQSIQALTGSACCPFPFNVCPCLVSSVLLL